MLEGSCDALGETDEWVNGWGRAQMPTRLTSVREMERPPSTSTLTLPSVGLLTTGPVIARARELANALANYGGARAAADAVLAVH